MKHALIGAFVMTFAGSILLGICVWGYSMNVQALRPNRIRTATEILQTSAMPQSWVSLWKTAPRLVLSGISICLSVMWAYFFIDFSGPKAIFKLSISTKFWWVYNHTSRQDLFTVYGIWLTLFGAALIFFVRSAMGFLGQGASPNSPTIREHFQRAHRIKRLVLTAFAVVLGVLIRWRYHDLTRIQADIFLLVLLVPILIALGLGPAGRCKCPRCASDLKRLQAEQVGRMRGGSQKPWELWDACPNCHVSFDEPYSSRPSSTPAVN